MVVESSENIYKEMIDTLYNQRREIKALMKPLAKKIQQGTANEEDIQEYTRLNLKQETCKLLLNSTFGKLAWASLHDIQNYVSGDSKYLLEQFALGNITKISKLNDRYTQYSGV